MVDDEKLRRPNGPNFKARPQRVKKGARCFRGDVYRGKSTCSKLCPGSLERKNTFLLDSLAKGGLCLSEQVARNLPGSRHESRLP